MIAKKIRNEARRSDGRASFGVRVTYICRKAVRIQMMNLAGHWTDAARQMDMTVRLNRMVRQPALHLVLTWSGLERPDPDDMIAAARLVLEEFGASQFQCIIAIHLDRPSPHLHILCNRVHPVTGKSLSLSHDYARLEAACRKAELRFGWPQDRGRFKPVITDGEVTLDWHDKTHWSRKLTARAEGWREHGKTERALEARTSLPPLREALTDRFVQVLREMLGRAPDWQSVHAELATQGLIYRLAKGGARIFVAGLQWFMPASHLGTEVGLPRMTERLGPFIPADDATISRAMSLQWDLRDLLSKSRPKLFEMVAAAASLTRQTPARDPGADARRQARSDLARHHAHERSELQGAATRLPGLLAEILRTYQQMEHREDRTRLRQRSGDGHRSWRLQAGLSRADGPDPILSRRIRQIAIRSQRAGSLDQHGFPKGIHATGHPMTSGAVPATDHTALRQIYELEASSVTLAGDQSPSQRWEKSNADICAVPPDLVALARRNAAGGIVGFDLLDIRNSRRFDGKGADDGEGIILLGPRDASICMVLFDSAVVLDLAPRTGGEVLTLVVDRRLAPRVERQLMSLTADCKVLVAYRPFEREHESLGQLRVILRHARFVPIPDKTLAKTQGVQSPDLSRKVDEISATPPTTSADKVEAPQALATRQMTAQGPGGTPPEDRDEAPQADDLPDDNAMNDANGLNDHGDPGF